MSDKAKVSIQIDGEPYEVTAGNNLLQECLSKGIDLPYFCWHPCMGSVGACRQCAVKQYKDADDSKGILVMACMTQATAGAIISVEDAEARAFRANVIESLMISHPHDCPVCEEGGECHLQDMTQMSGHNYRRYDFNKVTHNNQYLGPFINHEMNRCIACYRCVRFYDDYAGGTDLSAQAAHHHVYFGRHEEGTLESEFSGNLVEVCPTGVFTDKCFSKHYTRKWDLQSAPSVCTGCGVGCNTTPGERYGSLRRIVNRYNSEVNGYFICDRGRFGAGYVNNEDRLDTAVNRDGSTEQVLDEIGARNLVDDYKSAGAIGIGSPRASNEANFALRTLVGADNFYAGYADAEHECVQLMLALNQDKAFHNPSIREIEQADAVIVIGEDVTNTAARIALALRQAVRNKALELADNCHIPRWQDAAVRELAQDERSPLAILSPYATRLEDVASDVLVDAPAELAALAGQVAASIDAAAPAAKTGSEHGDTVTRIAQQLQGAKRPLVIAGSSSGNVEYIKAAANIARALHASSGKVVDLCLLTTEVNTLGCALLAGSDTLGNALEKMASGKVSHAIVLENDLYRRANHQLVDKALAGVANLMVLDQLPTATTNKARALLPTTTFSEHEATYINYEGRAQISFQVNQCAIPARPAWRWLSGDTGNTGSFVKRCAEAVQSLGRLDEVLPADNILIAGMKVPRQSHRYSGRTAMIANINVHEPKQPQDNDSILSFSMEGISPLKDATILGSAWAPAWNSNQSISKFQDEVNGELKQCHTGSLLFDRGASGKYLAPSSAENAQGKGLAVSQAFQLFGSDELSAHTASIQQRMTGPYVSLAPADADNLGVQSGDTVTVNGNGAVVTVCVRTHMKAGTAAIYCGNNEIDAHALGSHVVLARSDTAASRGIKGLIVSDLLEEAY
ncbi:MAG: NADH-quinone oxidoreductase subunit NuoG [Gammaproteobacteria bacterium]